MKYRSTKKKFKEKIEKPVRKNPCRFLVLIDQEPIRREVQKEYEKVHKELQKIESRIETHETINEPAYQNWISQEFGALITEARELDELVYNRANWLELLEAVRFRNRLSPAEAYAKAVELRDKPEQEPDVKSFENQADDMREDADDDDLDDMGMSEQEKKFFNAFFGGRNGPEGSEFDEFKERLMNGGRKQNPGPHQKEIKELYRAIVRILHPDRAGEFNPLLKELWHQAQEAYSRGDKVMLQVVLARCEAGESGVKSIGRISVIVEMCKQVMGQIRLLQDKLNYLKRIPSWGFSTIKPQKLAKIKKQTQDGFKSDIQELGDDLRGINREIAQYESAHQNWLKKETKKQSQHAPVSSKPPLVSKKVSPPPVPNQSFFDL